MADRGPARHVPVLRDRVVELLAPALQQPGAVVVDATLGMGGHAQALLRACPQARLVALDRDHDALEHAAARLVPQRDRIDAVHAVYDELPEVLDGLGIETVDGLLFDLGVSSLQLDDPDRGFAYRDDVPLDMRMDQSDGSTAAEVLNTYDAADLERILRDYGEERFARRVARALVAERARRPFETSAQLVEVLQASIPARSQRTGGHPAKRTFQALRIEVNRELSVWASALPAALDRLAVAGRIAVLSYHSLEDRITKTTLASAATGSTPAGLPVELPEHQPWLRLLTRGAEKASPAETQDNSRAASVRLRAAERIRPSRPVRKSTR
ncbi:MAG: 16S rRNA (cytosine(1402)-N(4))-methyltransferase RsmH [Ornithinimicrobium sp.]|uniref:16S rRNA (cytosine(1402)-N(4))-methyltransferase RsmH n=1 Tax=Ornithinimicrobium sp. TaxID=1977084 RepID=UPI003D9AF41B